jgi:beta-glucosidase
MPNLTRAAIEDNPGLPRANRRDLARDALRVVDWCLERVDDGSALMHQARARAGLVLVPMVVVLAGCSSGVQPGSSSVASVASSGAAKVASGGSVNAGNACTPKHFRLETMKVATRQAKHLVAKMSLPQEVDLMDGVGYYGGAGGTVGATAPIPRLKVPAINEEDGPGGIGDGEKGVTQLPAPIALAATFDTAAARCYGQVIGTEARRKGIDLMYAPTVNLVRVPQWGRAFESFGEDPVLSGTVGAAEVHGIQRSGVMAQVKHFAVYNQETNRNTKADDAIVAERTLQETYLKVWRLVAKADPSSMMCSYSTINGSPACQDSALLRGFLDHQLGFKGFIGSDYSAVKSTVLSVNAGLDQEQPSPVYFGTKLIGDVRAGIVARSVVDQAVTRIVTQMYRFRMFTDDATVHPNRDVASAADAQVARKVAEESTVLLKNDHGALPLSPHGSIAVIGTAASSGTTTVGGGSATVLSPGTVTPLHGIRAHASSAGAVTYTPGLPALSAFTPVPAGDLSKPYPVSGTVGRFSTTLTAPQTGTYIFGFTPSGIYQQVTLSVDGVPLINNAGTPPVSTYTAAVHFTAGSTHRIAFSGPSNALSWVTPNVVQPLINAAASAAAAAKTAVVVVGDDQESEAADRASLALPSAQNALIDAVATANPHTVVVVEAGAALAMPWLSKVSAVVDQWYSGQTDGNSLAAVLFGEVNPSGHLPVTFPTSLAHTPVSSPSRFPGVNGRVHYTEGRNIGYRWWIDTHHKPLFPFGYGLSYTTFHYSKPVVRVSHRGASPVVTVREVVKNTGKVAGADVAQLYLGFPASAGEPERQLESYQRVNLRPGRSAVAMFRLSGLQLAYFTHAHWLTPSGRYRVYVGDSAAAGQLSAAVPFRLTHSDRP